DIGSAANQRAAEFAAAVRRVAESGGVNCQYLPLFDGDDNADIWAGFEQTFAALPSTGGRPYNGINFFAWCCLLCWDVHIMHRDLAEIQRERQLGVTIDLVHLGPEAANELASMVCDFVRSSSPGLAVAEII
ncbi:unnamed protein product, partial [Polarella glacialis]